MQKKLKLGFDAKRAFYNYRGLGNYSRLLLEGLSRWGAEDVELHLFTPGPGAEDYRDWFSSGLHKRQPRGLSSMVPSLWRAWGQVGEWKKSGLQLYHGLSHELPWNAKAAKSSVKLVVTIHDLIFLRHPELYPPWDRWIYIQKVKKACEVADSVLAISQQTKNDLIEFLKIDESKIKVLYQAIHPRYYKSEVGSLTLETIAPTLSGKPYFLFVGALEERKNIARLIEAMAAIEKQTECSLVLIGRGSLRKSLEELISQRGLQDRVFLKCDVKTSDLPAYYQNARALVYPSLFEGFGLPIAEAMMSGTLSITSQGSCFPESGGPGSFYVDPLRVEELASCLLEVANQSDQQRQLLLDKNQQFVAQFHWKQVSENLLNHYKRILNQ